MGKIANIEKDVKIAFRITAIPERISNVEKQLAVTGIKGDSVYLDNERKGNIWNKFRALNDVLKSGQYTHVCMNDDDLIMPQNFVDAVYCLVKRFPDCIFSFYNSKVGGERPQIVRLRNHHMAGSSCVIPVSILKDFFNFYSFHLGGFKWDDTAISMYALLHNIDVLLPIPKIIDVACIKSSLSMRKNQISPSNKGAVYYGKVNIQELACAPVVDGGTRFLNTHLPQGHTLRNIIEGKEKENCK